jgi:hypothetical protein
LVAGVEDVWWSSSEQKVWVQGTASAQELKTRLETKLRRPVSILSHRVIDPPAPSRSRAVDKHVRAGRANRAPLN